MVMMLWRTGHVGWSVQWLNRVGMQIHNENRVFNFVDNKRKHHGGEVSHIHNEENGSSLMYSLFSVCLTLCQIEKNHLGYMTIF